VNLHCSSEWLGDLKQTADNEQRQKEHSQTSPHSRTLHVGPVGIAENTGYILVDTFLRVIDDECLAVGEWDSRGPQLLVNESAIDSNYTFSVWLEPKLPPKIPF
jgi:hypothetical protein